MNEACRDAQASEQIAHVYMNAADAQYAGRTWQDLFELIVMAKRGNTRQRWERAIRCRGYDPLRTRPLIETKAEDLLGLLEKDNRTSVNDYLKRAHNFAIKQGFVPKPIRGRSAWPPVVYKPKRAIREDEYRRIVEREGNPERRAFYHLLWHLGGSQGDIAKLCAENVDWESRTITYVRAKLRRQT